MSLASAADQCLGASQHIRQSGPGIATSEFELGLGQEDRGRKIRTGELRPAEIGSHEVGPPQVSAAQVGIEQHRAP